MNSKFPAFLVAFLLLISGSLTTATVVDSPPDARPVYQKPAPMGALDWIQYLEDERDQADIAGDYAGFKAITDEISATIAGKHGFSEERATPEEELAIIHSITRTRHRFMGQRHMLHDRYLGYDRAQTTTFLQTDARFKDHMAAVLAIDAMVMKAMNDDDFSDDWADTKKDPQELIPGIIAHAQKYEKKEVFESLTPAFQHFLQTRRDTLRLANDVFSVFAPKMTLVKFYNEVVPSGDTYKGWTVHNAGAFRYSATLTEEEKAEHPGLESKIRRQLNQGLTRPNMVSDVFSSSERATPPSDDIRTRFDLNQEEMVVEYVYDDCLLERGYGVRGAGPISFYLSRPVSPQLARILRRRHGVIPNTTMLETYRCETMALINDAPNMIKAAAQRGISSALNRYAFKIFYAEDGIERDIPKAIELYIEAAELGNSAAQSNLPIKLNQYSVKHFNGEDGIERDIPKAIELCREAAALGHEDSIRDLPPILNGYAVNLFKGIDSIAKDIPKAIELFREAGSLGYEKAIENLSIALHDYAVCLFHGRDGIVKDRSKAVEFCREAAGLGSTHASRNLPLMIAQAGGSR